MRRRGERSPIAEPNTEEGPPEARAHLQEISSHVSLALKDARSIAYNLRPYQLERAGVSRTLQETFAHLEICDDGMGLPADRPRRSGSDSRGGMGLVDIRERVRLLGGSCAIESTPGLGELAVGLLVLAALALCVVMVAAIA